MRRRGKPNEHTKYKQAIFAGHHTPTIMLSLSKFLLFAPYLIPILASAHHSQRQGPFALTLNPTSIIASRVNSSGRVELRTYQVTSEYLSYFDDTISQFDPQNRFNESWECSKAAISTFRTAIAGITKDLTGSLGYRPKYSTLVFPAIFSRSSWCAAYRAIRTSPDDDDRPFDQLKIDDRPFSERHGGAAACEAYDLFHRCDRLGRAPEDCNDDGPVNLIIGVEYEQSYMHVRLFEMVYDHHGYANVAEKMCLECGLRFNKVCEPPS
jgi:hypothetical protein